MIQRFFAGIPIGFFSFSWLTFIFSYKSPLCFEVALPGLSIMLGLSVVFTKISSMKKLKVYIRFTRLEILTLAGFSLFFLHLMYYSMLKGGNRSKGAGYGDLPFHLNIISGFTNGCNHIRNSFFIIDTVFYSGEKLAYPYMTNYFTAALMATGNATFRGALFIPSFMMSLSLLFGIYYLGILFHKDHFACLIAIFMFINLGGLGFLCLLDPTFEEGDLIHDWGKEHYEYWFHPIMHILVPQRASLWSMPLCYWCLIILIKGIKVMKWQYFLIAALYVGITPLVQVHSYVALAQWSLVFAALNFPWKNKSKMLSHVFVWSIFGIVANILCVPQFVPYLKRLSVKKSDGGSGFLLFDPIWNSDNRKREWSMAIKLWWRGLGLFAFISLISCWFILTKSQKIDYIPSIVVFLLTNVIRYQPWELDNTKVFYAGWIPFAIHCYGLFMAKLLRHKKWRLIGIIILFFSCLSAIRLYVIEMSLSTPMFENDVVEFGNWVSENTPIDSIWLTDHWHGNPVLTIAGRQSFMGYGGWLLSHGLDYFGRDSDSTYMMEHPDDLDFFRKRNITYVVSFKKSFRNWENITIDNNWVKIYDYDAIECWKYVPDS